MFIVDFFKNDNFDLLSVSAAVSYMFMFFYITKKGKVESIVKKETYETKYYDKFDLLEIKELEKEYINGLKNRGKFIKTEKWKKVKEINKNLASIIRDPYLLNKFQKPVSVFASFESEEGRARALVYNDTI